MKYAREGRGGAMWPVLIEKAVARFVAHKFAHTGDAYDSLQMGQAGYAMQLLTGERDPYLVVTTQASSFDPYKPLRLVKAADGPIAWSAFDDEIEAGALPVLMLNSLRYPEGPRKPTAARKPEFSATSMWPLLLRATKNDYLMSFASLPHPDGGDAHEFTDVVGAPVGLHTGHIYSLFRAVEVSPGGKK